MKHFFKILAIAFIGIFIISCEKDEDQAVITETIKSKVTPDKTTIVLDKANPDNVALNITWNKSTFNIPVVYTQQIQFAIKGENFKDASTTEVTTSPLAYTNKQLNNIALSLGAATNVSAEIEVRIRTLVGAAPFYSDVTTLVVTPYLLGPTYKYTDLYLIGDATSAGWDNSETNAKFLPLQKTAATGVYSYVGYFAQGGFKLIKTPGSWDTQYGLGGSAGALSTSATSGNISVSAAGYYKLTVDTNALTYTFTAIAPPTVSYTTISMIGTASGDWSTDVDLQKSTFDPHIWVKKNAAMNSGEFKFRANHDWGTNWGKAQEFFGVAELGGGNIPVSETFKYDVYFNDITAEYSLIPIFK
ncbi:SusE domain-containing protein [Chryseobacterium sp. MEBOG06]|uniref:SusE domain-containing protein n=1 Tax=unclassified Chryseobacterium TaxID=2593645 RepID=UPI001F19332B|nr:MULTISPECIES: SusE domain-containing protein [unclassified Chryseobacterium]UKB85541.1 SusE domain-containing protein [Chryseobacterium sp. MEBOG06]